jgi:diphthine-ammonia ligase
MTVSALVSGGKDSVYAAYLADTQGRPVDEVLVLRPADPASRLFHTPNLDLVRLQAEAWGKSYREVAVPGDDDRSELETLTRALEGGRGGWVVTGAIESSFQWARLLRAGDAVGRPVYAPLWRKDPRRVVAEEIAAGLDIRIAHVAADGLDDGWLGTRLDRERLERLGTGAGRLRHVHPAGEGGEFESLVLHAPFWRSRVVVDEVAVRSVGAAATWEVRKAHLERTVSPSSGAAAP